KRQQRPAAVTLQDAMRVAEDFTVLRTTRQAARDFLEQFDFTALAGRLALDYLDGQQPVLIVRATATRYGPEGMLDIYDANLRRRLELQVDPTPGYCSRAGQEFPAAGLRVIRAWDLNGSDGNLREQVLEPEGVVLPPRV